MDFKNDVTGTTVSYGWCKKCFQYHDLRRECPQYDWWDFYTKPVNIVYSDATKEVSEWEVILERRITDEISLCQVGSTNVIHCKALWNETERVVKLIVNKDVTAECVANKEEAFKWANDYFASAIEDLIFTKR